MSHPDIKKEFEEVFADCMYTITREAGVFHTVDQLNKFQDVARKAGKRLALKVEQSTLDVCASLQDRVEKAFEKVREDMNKMDKRVKVLEKRHQLREGDCLPPREDLPKDQVVKKAKEKK